ncbi:hypothetical protein [Shewanella psychrotolerans]|uniref:hypothetical protein n=1 Tax=Shewanella psychrotolerans TaxID=2864206 RepID=UPI001C65FFC9|nr:hypothetical protein [Shewanella psychrotolerans]QYK02394.1 hypothetical protein K0I62_05425 [Shewanella psychrotolerans]
MKDNTHEPLFDEELKRLYQIQATEQPSKALDEQILNRAKCAIEPKSPKVIKPKADFWRQYRWSISSAASVMLVVSLLLLNPNNTDVVIMDGGQPLPQISSKMMAPEVKPQALEMKPAERAQFRSEDNLSSGVKSENSATLKRDSQSLVRQHLADDVVTENTTSMSQARSQIKAVISDQQAINHLAQLVDTQQWQQAAILLARIDKERPQLSQVDHPQHQQWKTLTESVELHIQPK